VERPIREDDNFRAKTVFFPAAACRTPILSQYKLNNEAERLRSMEIDV